MQQNVEDRQAVRFCALTRAGVTVSLISFFTIVSVEVFKRSESLNSNSRFGVLGLTLMGALLVATDVPSLVKAARPDEILLFYRKRYYWGVLFCLLGASVFVFSPGNFGNSDEGYEEHRLVKRDSFRSESPGGSMPAPAAPATPSAAARSSPNNTEVSFPKLSISAVVVNGAKSGATVNGRDLWIGEGMQGVKLVGVSETNIVVEFKGSTRTVAFEAGP